MARLAGKDANFSYNSVAIEDELKSIEQNTEVPLPEVTAFADSATEVVEGKPNSTISLSGSADFAASQGDATLFGQIGSGEAAFDNDPTGTAVGANNPHYTGNALVKSYRLTIPVAGAVSYSAELQVNGALSRDVA